MEIIEEKAELFTNYLLEAIIDIKREFYEDSFASTYDTHIRRSKNLLTISNIFESIIGAKYDSVKVGHSPAYNYHEVAIKWREGLGDYKYLMWDKSTREEFINSLDEVMDQLIKKPVIYSDSDNDNYILTNKIINNLDKLKRMNQNYTESKEEMDLILDNIENKYFNELTKERREDTIKFFEKHVF